MNEVENEKIEKLKKSRQNILDKNFNIYFFIEEAEFASAAICEIYTHVKTLKEFGFDVKLLTQKKDYKVPEWLDDDLKALPHITSEGNNFSINPEDYLIIPELFSNVMEQTKNLPCSRIVLLQSFENALRGLVPGASWYDFGIQNLITTSPTLTELSKEYLGTYDTKEYIIGIPEYFKPSSNGKPKSPFISFYARNPKEIEKIVKLFYSKYPHYRFLSFEDLRGTSREKFAEKIRDSFACLILDRIASFGTVAIEAMKSNTLPVGIIPDTIPEYISKDVDNGFWSDDIMVIPDFIAEAVRTQFQYQIPTKVYEDMEKTSAKYNVKDSKQSIIDTYSYFFDKRVNEIQNFIENNLNQNLN